MMWWSRLWRRGELEQDLSRELQFHIAERIRSLQDSGLSEAEARRQVRQEFGGIEQVKEECRDARGTLWIENLYRDIRFALRSLSRTPGFSFLAIAILTLGIGATTAMFSITRTVLLKPLAYRDPGRLVTISFSVPQFSKTLSTIPVNAQHYELWRDHNRTLEEISVIGPDSHILSGRGQPVQVSGLRVSPNLFHLLGIQPAIGRGFINRSEGQAGHQHLAVISYRLWQEKLGGRADVLGQTLLLDGQPYEVIGVMPQALPFPRGKQLSELEILPEHADYWIPLVFDKDDLASPDGNENYLAIARMKPGVTTRQVWADMTALEKVISKRYREPIGFDPVVRPLQQAMARDVRLPLLLLMAAVVSVLLIVCINLTNLMLVRAIAQKREWAIRVAVGARTRELLRSAFVESLCLSATGGALGCLLAICLVKLVQRWAPVDLPRINELGVDGPVLLLALGLSIASAFVFGLWPAWRAAQVDPQEALQSSARTGQGRRGHRSGKLLVAAEVALSTVLLLTAGLLLRSFAAILDVNPGMNIQHVLTARINLPPDRYRQGKDIASFYKRLSEQVSTLPGVKAAGLISDLPLTGENNNNPATAGDRPAPPLTQWQMTNYRAANKTYFNAAGIPLKEGRTFSERDGDTTEVMISANLAERLWPGQSAVGRPLRIYSYRPMNVVGVVGATYAASLTQQPTMMVYFPEWRRQDLNMSLVVRTENNPESLSGAVRRIVYRLEPQAAIPFVQPMRQVMASSLSERRFQLILFTAFAAMALTLACLGIYGVLAFTITSRTAEIGIRMALGARPGTILRSTLGSGMTPVFAGILIGLGISAALARIIAHLLFQVRAIDPWTYIATSAVLLIIAALACLLPARRAARLNPIQALRTE